MWSCFRFGGFEIESGFGEDEEAVEFCGLGSVWNGVTKFFDGHGEVGVVVGIRDWPDQMPVQTRSAN